MNTTDTVPFLTQLGIKRCQQCEGKPCWTLNVEIEETGAQTRSVHFDEQLGVWRMKQPQKDKVSSIQMSKKDTVAKHRRNSATSETHWTDSFPYSAHSQFIINVDWGATSLGPIKTWPRSLQLYTQVMLSDYRPAAIYWGPERIAIYNEATIHIIGAIHPTLMGASFKDVLPETYSYFAPLYHALENGEHGFACPGLEVPTWRNGYLEETWWDGGLIGLTNDHGDYGGSYFSWTETTRTVLRDRRTQIINRLGQLVLSSTGSYWNHINAILAENPRDFPMAVVYSTDEEHPSNGRLQCEHTIGIGDTCTAVPTQVDLTSTAEPSTLVSLLRRAQDASADFLVIDLMKENIDATIFQDANWLGFGEPILHLAMIPLRDNSLIKGYVLLGLNPRRTLDKDHEQFVTEIALQLKQTMIRATREKVLTTELNESESRASRMADIVPVGIYELGADGRLRWANNQFFEIMGVPLGHRQIESFAWADHIHPEDHDRATQKMGQSLLEAIDITDTLRLRKNWQPPGLNTSSQTTVEPFWIMYSALPNVAADGSITSLTGSITDISHLKWAEQLQIRNAQTAQKERQIQEEFIDITSHEMRNPLSAITQSADGILLSLKEARDVDDVSSLREIINHNADAAESILFCAAHQKRIIDDVLTLGKLDSRLLTISPIVFHLEDLLNQVMRVFKAEFEVNDIHIQTDVDLTPVDSRQNPTTVSTFNGDSSRILQVLVNLVTNAIKFTKSRSLRNIRIRCGSSYAPPSAHIFGSNFQWHSTNIPRPDLTRDPEYGPGDSIFLHFAITDSGEGIPPDALGRIFTKFEQADRRTHTKYGGSGLGLYISRELTELQGGRIGIQSTVGVGSTFAFYTKARYPEAQPLMREPGKPHHQSASDTAGNLDLLSLGKDHVSSVAQLRSTLNILVVEDNVLNQTVLKKQLERSNCKIQTCNNGGEAVDIILRKCGQSARYSAIPSDNTLAYLDCILMHWEMPVCDGIQATKMIRSIEETHGATRSLIIGITANAREAQIKIAREVGMDEVVPKPFRVADLLSRIRSYLQPA